MLSAQENALISSTNKGTPMGELFRRFWLPAFVPDELPGPDAPPIRTRILGEDLVAFRDTNGNVGVLEAFCPHRRAPLFFGRNEECGLRCVYHGWKFDTDGTCVDMPSEPAESDFKEKVRVAAYPTREWGGVIWIYMGPPDKMPPDLPRLEWALVPDSHRRVNKSFQECNWLQAMEGDIDTAHISYLHSRLTSLDGGGVVRTTGHADKAPRLMVVENDCGFAYGGRRVAGPDEYYWRVTQFLFPNYAFIPAYSWPKACTYTLPADDQHCFRMGFFYNIEAPVKALPVGVEPTPEQIAKGTAPVTRWGQYTFNDGLVIDTYLHAQNKGNMYGLDREMQRGDNYTGIVGIATQDRAMTEGMGYVCDRTREHLGTTDIAIIAARRRLLQMAHDLEEGTEPFAPSHPDGFRLRALDVNSPEPDLARLLELHREAISVTAEVVS